MYADLCERIARTPIPGLGEAAGKDSSKGSKKFRKMLLLKVQAEFEKDWQGLFAAVQVRVLAVSLPVLVWSCRSFFFFFLPFLFSSDFRKTTIVGTVCFECCLLLSCPVAFFFPPVVV